MIDYEKLYKDLATNLDFICHIDEIKNFNDPLTLAYNFFVIGYASSLEYKELKEKTRAFKWKPYKELL